MPAWVRLIVLTWLAKILKYDLKKKKENLRRHSLFVDIAADRYRETQLDIGMIYKTYSEFTYFRNVYRGST
jgi:hypothetical protein